MTWTFVQVILLFESGGSLCYPVEVEDSPLRELIVLARGDDVSGHDEAMLINLVRIVPVDSGPPLASFRSGVGNAVVRWCGDPQDLPGPYHVEWTINADLAWGDNLQPVASPEEAVRNEEQDLLVRGRLSLAADNAPSIELGGTPILLDWIAPPPLDVSGTWVELRTHRDRAALYPF